MRLNTRKLLILVVSLAWVSIGHASVSGDWKKAQKEGTWSAYMRFVSKHPQAPEAAEARRRIFEMEREIAWKAAMADQSSYQSTAIARYLEKYPDSPHEAEAQAKSRELFAASAWERTKQSDYAEAYRHFARDFPDSPFAAEALTRAEAARVRELQADWDRTVKLNQTSALREFIARNPGAPQEGEAKSRIDAIVTERERTALEPLRSAMAQARSLNAVPLQQGNFAKNLAVRSPGSVMSYDGAFVRAVGEIYAKKPGEQTFDAVTPASFVILAIGKLPEATSNVIAHTARASWPVGYVVDANRAMTLVIPNELIPCELEFVDALHTRIPLKSRPK